MKTVKSKLKDITLSHSSANLLRGCEQKYVYYKVLGIEKDSDSEQSEDNFNVGKAVHFILEQMLHEFNEPDFFTWLERAGLEFDINHKIELVAALAFRLFKLHKKEGLHVVECEYRIHTNHVLGYVDLIASDDAGGWWIIDVKTAAKLYDFTVAKLHNDYQLNLYAAHYKLIAKDLKLDPDKFLGCRYRVVTKSRAALKKDEQILSYIKRTQKGISALEVIVPVAMMKPDAVLKEHRALWRRAKKLHEGSKAQCNYGHCSSFFRPCEYWSKCHGDIFTNAKDELEIHEY